MNAMIRYILFFVLALLSLNIKAQFDPDNVCRVEGDRIIFKFDLRWNEKQKKEIATLFELDSSLIQKAYHGSSEIVSGGITWKVKKIKPNHIEVSIPIDLNDQKKDENAKSNKSINANKNYVYLLDDSWIKDVSAKERESAMYGVNNFTKNTIFQYKNKIARFYLPGYKNAKKVYLAGAFNNWSTKQTPMQYCDSGWIASLKLLPGKYSYKYIADEMWMEDPYNKRKENDGFGNINSILFCYNYLFELKGRTNAKKVVVAGTFNSWNKNELRMNKVSYGWNLPMYLKEGTHAYKFVVDNEWLTDPENKVTHNDGKGSTNSIMGIGNSYLFQLKGFTSARKVILAGNFNNWTSGELLMVKVDDGWQLPYVLASGIYEYKFIVDGKWIIDPANPYINGSGNFENSVLAFKANHTFILNKYPNAKKVIVTGNFNKWNREGYRMVKKDGKWIFPAYLRSGKTTYKFIVDNQWILDPDNKFWEENEYGTGNSVLWMGE